MDEVICQTRLLHYAVMTLYTHDFSKSTLKELEEYASGLQASQKADFDSINKNDGSVLKGMQEIIFQKAQSHISMVFDLVS